MTTASEPRPNILVVDDVLDNLRFMKQALSDEGFYVRPSQSGSLALAAARLDLPDLVLMDIDMPEMNGYEVCRAFKQDPALCEVPILFLSALDATFDRVRAFQAGGIDYVSKPFQLQELLARVRTHISLHRLQRERRHMIEKLSAALEEIKTLKGFLPICANCKSIRNDEGYWERVEAYLYKHADVQLSHGICPPCAEQLYPGLTGRRHKP